MERFGLGSLQSCMNSGDKLQTNKRIMHKQVTHLLGKDGYVVYLDALERVDRNELRISRQREVHYGARESFLADNRAYIQFLLVSSRKRNFQLLNRADFARRSFGNDCACILIGDCEQGFRVVVLPVKVCTAAVDLGLYNYFYGIRSTSRHLSPAK